MTDGNAAENSRLIAKGLMCTQARHSLRVKTLQNCRRVTSGLTLGGESATAKKIHRMSCLFQKD